MKKYKVIGVDEVGRGPLAGPVTVCAVLKPKRFLWKNFKDSKKLSPKKREEFFLKFKTMPHAVAFVGPTVIDKIGMSAAARLAVGRCLKKLTHIIKKPPLNPLLTKEGRGEVSFKILLDGNLYAPKTYLNQQTIIKGDEKIPVIATASIIAKVKRDRYMVRMHKIFPKYGFAIHKGYGTKLHQTAIRHHGLCEIHRKSFCKKFI